MPIIGTTPKKSIEAQYKVINELQEKCRSCLLFDKKTADNICIYTVHSSEYTTEDGAAMIAIAKYGDTYAIHPPEYLTGKQWTVLEFFLRDIKRTDKLVVFAQETFENLGKYSHGKSLNVQLCV